MLEPRQITFGDDAWGELCVNDVPAVEAVLRAFVDRCQTCGPTAEMQREGSVLIGLIEVNGTLYGDTHCLYCVDADDIDGPTFALAAARSRCLGRGPRGLTRPGSQEIAVAGDEPCAERRAHPGQRGRESPLESRRASADNCVVDDVAKLMKRIPALTAQISDLAEAPGDNADQLSVLLRELEQAEAEHLRAMRAVVERAASPGGAGASAPRTPPRSAVRTSETPVRERVLAALDLLGVPARGSLVSVAAWTRTGLDVEPRQLASLRRSELASWRSAPDRRPAYVVPALHSRRFEPLRGIVASSVWEPWRRVVGPLSPRADHVRATIRLAENVQWAREQAPDLAERYEQLLWRLAGSVPSTLDDAPFNVDTVVSAARDELAMLDEDDRSERDEAARRLVKLPAEQQLFGAGLHVVGEESA